MMSRIGQFGWIAAFGIFVLTVGCELEEGDGTDTDFSDAGTDAGGSVDSGGGDDRCVSDGLCEPQCGGTDPDCACDCDRLASRCDAVSSGSSAPCICDPACGTACGSDGTCDNFCPPGADPDCDVETCDCDYYGGICEADAPDSSDFCDCDDDCGAGDRACSADSHCDTFCPDGFDPDCDDPPACDCDYNDGICEAAERGSSETCACDEDCAGTDACKSDGHCDTWCPDGFDPDC